MNILIIGYGNIGRHIYEEFKSLQPEIYDPFIAEYSAKQNKHYDFAFICVPTDSFSDGSCDTSIVEQAVNGIDAEIIVIKSTVPPGTTKRLIGATDTQIVFSPEHYGVTQHCKSDPGFVILGGEKEHTAKVAELYGKVKSGYYKIHFTDATTAELSKYMLNSFLALKVTFCNEFADLAAKFDTSYPELRELFIADERVGSSHTFVYPDKPYYDSHCFNKDVPALVNFAQKSAPLMAYVNELNQARKMQHKKESERTTSPELTKLTAIPQSEQGESLINTVKAEDIEALQEEIARLKNEERHAFIAFAESGRAPDKEQKLKTVIAAQETKQRELEVLNTVYTQSAREFLLNKIAQTNFQHDCSICLIIRDENEYLEEWLRWHIGQGVEHFYIYDHGSKEPVEQFVQSLSAEIAEKVTVIDWSGPHDNAQPDAYNDCLKRFGKESKWIGFIDTDEHVRVKNGKSLPVFLKDFEDFAGFFAVWNTYGANGQRTKTKLPLRERFTEGVPSHMWAHKAGKVFVQPLLIKEMVIHNGYPIEGFDVVDERKEIVPEAHIQKENVSTDLICVDHFYTKSYEEWLEKLRRGRCHYDHARKYEEFFEYNPDMEYCREEVFPVQEYELSDKTVEGYADVQHQKKEKGNYYICAIVKDEHDYIREWALYNQSLGFDKIVLYDNGNSESYDAELGDLIREGFVEVKPWNDDRWSRQVRAYNDFVRSENWTENDYCAFIDPDEFIYFDNVKTVADFMKLYADYSGVGLSWRTYNADGHIESPNGKIPTTKAYTTEFEYWGPRVKMIGRLTDIGDIYSPHVFRPKEGCPPLVTTGGEVIVGQEPYYRDYTNGHIKHYMTKSWEDWVKRLKRGNVTKGLRKVDTFFEFNPEMEHLREELVKDLDYKEFPTIRRDFQAWDGE